MRRSDPGLSPWSSPLAPALAEAARSRGVSVLGALRDRQRVTAAIDLASREPVAAARWVAPSVAQGFAGLAVACGQLDCVSPGQGWDRAAHEYLGRAVEDLSTVSLGAFAGMSGLRWATQELSRDGLRYQLLASQLEDEIMGPLAGVRRSRLTSDGGATEVQKAGLFGGRLYGIKVVSSFRDEDRAAAFGDGQARPRNYLVSRAPLNPQSRRCTVYALRRCGSERAGRKLSEQFQLRA